MTVVRIALGAMGGNHAPHEIVKGALLAAAESPIEVLLVGQEEVVRKELAALGEATPRSIEVVDAREVVEMDDTAIAPIRRKRNSSIRVCANLVSEGRADAFVSAGNTGATWTSARVVMGMIEGVSRPPSPRSCRTARATRSCSTSAPTSTRSRTTSASSP